MTRVRNLALAIGLVMLPVAALAQANPPLVQQRDLAPPNVQPNNKQTAVSTTRPSVRAKSRRTHVRKAAVHKPASSATKRRVHTTASKRVVRPKPDAQPVG